MTDLSVADSLEISDGDGGNIWPFHRNCLIIVGAGSKAGDMANFT